MVLHYLCVFSVALVKETVPDASGWDGRIDDTPVHRIVRRHIALACSVRQSAMNRRMRSGGPVGPPYNRRLVSATLTDHDPLCRAGL